MSEQINRRSVVGLGGIVFAGNAISEVNSQEEERLNGGVRRFYLTMFMTDFEVQSVRTGVGSVDVTVPVLKALDVANGGKIYVPPGRYLISQPLSNTNSKNIRMEGESWSFLSHDAAVGVVPDTNSSKYLDLPSRDLSDQYAVFLCNGCSLIGAMDTDSPNASNKLRELKNVIVWGMNNAMVGVHSRGSDALIDGVTFVLFKFCAILTRGQIVSKFGAIATIDCGWGVDAVGAVGYPATYYSGCAFLLLSNNQPNDYWTVVPKNRSTTMDLSGPFFFWVRNHTEKTKSGMRGIQASGFISSNIRSLGGYTGNYFNLCFGTQIDGHYVENYSMAGLNAHDENPVCMYFVNSAVHIGQGYTSNMSGLGAPFVELDNEIHGVNHRITKIDAYGVPRPSGPFRPNFSMQIQAGKPGSTRDYRVECILKNSKAVAGFIAISLVSRANPEIYTRGFYAVANHRAGVKGWQPMASQSIAQDVDVSLRIEKHAVLNPPRWEGSDLILTITWSKTKTGEVDWQLDFAVFGCEPLSY